MGRNLDVGDKIRIISLQDEPNSRYIGIEGRITDISKDCYGEIRYGGTWGCIYIYPTDNIEKIN